MSQIAHGQSGKKLRDHLQSLLRDAGVDHPKLLLLHEDLPIHGSWTIFPILSKILHRFETSIDWFVFVDERSSIDAIALSSILDRHNATKKVFLGRSLQDKHASKIHHLEKDLDLKYPNFSAGFVLSRKLIEALVAELKDIKKIHGQDVKHFPRRFTVDAAYHLANVLFNMPLKSRRKTHSEHMDGSTQLTNDSRFCVRFKKGCATWITQSYICSPTQSTHYVGLLKETLFAVKTCEKFHEMRLPIINQTWASAAINIEYFSEVADSRYQTKKLPEVDGNYEVGHCKKTEGIINYFYKKAINKGWKWLVIVDDDTLISVQKILDLTKCYSSQDPIVLGQRYGYFVSEEKGHDEGYDFVAGGGGMVFSFEVVRQMMEGIDMYSRSHCTCPGPEYPDDMYFTGLCIKKLGLSVTHIDGFHQGSPYDYSADLLKYQDPISFHKFFNGEDNHIAVHKSGEKMKKRGVAWNFPLETYKTYFLNFDLRLKSTMSEERIGKEEL